MVRLSTLVTLLILVTASTARGEDDALKYRVFRYTGIGRADPARDREVVKNYNTHFVSMLAARQEASREATAANLAKANAAYRADVVKQAKKKSPEERERRIAEL